MSEENATKTALLFNKFHSPKISHFSLSLCLGYIGDKQVEEACRQLDPTWPEDMIYSGPRSIKIYQPALAENITAGTIFVPRQTGEDFCELALRRNGKGEYPKIACFRMRDHTRNDAGELVEVEGKLFGFGLPHPWKKDFRPDPNYVRLIDHRPGTDPAWPGFEPVWLKVKENGTSAALYYKLELVWVDEECPIVLAVLNELPDEEIPEALKSFDFTSRA